jgi:dienelactone hydrolase
MPLKKQTNIWVGALIVAACAATVFSNTLMDGVTTLAARWLTEAQSSDELWGKLEPHVTLTMPTAAKAPVPLVVMAPGCLGWRPGKLDRWRSFFLAAGHAVLQVDSFAARGLTDPKAIEAVACEGEGIYGFERAGDIAVVLEHLEFPPAVDQSHIVLAGWSHGAWTVWDLLHFVNLDKRPPHLRDWRTPEVAHFKAIIAFYPYCGFGSHSYARSLPVSAQALVFLATDDENVPTEPCRERMAELHDRGAQVELVEYAGATHWFDNNADFELLPHRYDPEATADAQRRVLALLRKLTGQEM